MMLLVGEYSSDAVSPAPERPPREGSPRMNRGLVAVFLAVFVALAAARGLVAAPAAPACDQAHQVHSAAVCSGQP